MKKENSKIAALSLAAVISTVSIIPAMTANAISANSPREAVTTTTAIPGQNASVNQNNTGNQNRAGIIKDKAEQEIQRRIEALNGLNNRIQTMQRISAETKTELAVMLQSQIASMNQIQGNIDSEEDATELLKQAKSITQSYRIFALVMPQGAIIAAADRVMNVAENMGLVGEKLEARIAEEESNGNDTSDMKTALEDFYSQIEQAKGNAQSAIDMVSALSPDEGDQEIMQSNLEVLKEAKAKIQAAQQNIVAARKDATDIVQTLKELGQTERIQTRTEAQVQTGTADVVTE